MQDLEVKIHGDFLHNHYNLTFLHMQLVMRHFSHGPRSDITPEALAYTKVKECGDANTLVSIESCICLMDGTETGPYSPKHSATSSPGAPSLCLHVQDMVFVERDKVLFIDPSSILNIDFDFLWICEHILYSDLISLIVDLIKAHSESELKPTRSASSNSCEVCR